jgi:hypothetical protein
MRFGKRVSHCYNDRRSMSRRAFAAALVGFGLAACSPALNWRTVRLEESGLTALFPCKPVKRDRQQPGFGPAAHMTMLSCDAADSVFAVSSMDVGDPAQVRSTLTRLKRSAAENIGAQIKVIGPATVPGATPNDDATVLRLEGKAPDRTALTEQTAFFTKGTRVFQAAVVSPAWNQEAADTFFEGLKLP